MRTPRSLIRNAVRAAVVAVALGGAVLGAAAPAQAAYFGYGWGFGPFPHPYPYYPYYPVYPHPVYPGPIYPHPYIPACLTNPQVRANLLSRGYYNISLYSPVGNIIRATAARGGHRYAITYNRCGAYIISATRLS